MKKKLIIGFVTLVIATTSIALAVTRVAPVNKGGEVVNPGVVHTARDAWTVFDDTVLSTGSEPTDLAVDERTYLTVLAAIAADVSGDGKIGVFLLNSGTRQGWNRLKFRCRGITDNGSATWQIYTGTLGGSPVTDETDCELAKVGQLAFTVGTQVSSLATYEMADAVTVTEGFSSVRAWLSASPGSEHVAEAELDVVCDVIVAVPTTITANSQLLIQGF